MKSQEELNAIKEEIETLNKTLAELTEEELEQVSGGSPKLIAPTLRLLLQRKNADFFTENCMDYIPLDSDARLSK